MSTPASRAERVLTFRVSGNYDETANRERLRQRIDGTIDALRALPGIEAAATANFLPGVPEQRESTFELVQPRRDAEPRMIAETRTVSPEYFATLRIPVLEGALCVPPVRPAAPNEVMVNRSFAARYLSEWPAVVGSASHCWREIARSSRVAGVVGDVRERGLDREPGSHGLFLQQRWATCPEFCGADTRRASRDRSDRCASR